jgi:hypothetical protein
VAALREVGQLLPSPARQQTIKGVVMFARAVRFVLAIVLAALAGSMLVPVHSAVASTGVKFTVTLTDVNPVTGLEEGDPNASGTAVLKLHPRAGKLCYVIKVRGLEAPTEPAPGIGDAHIHRTSDGSIAVDLATDFNRADGFYVATGCVAVSDALLRQIITDPNAFYINIHNAPYPGGALFGELT